MLKKLFIISSLTFSSVQAQDCRYSLPVIGVNYQGYSIYFDSYVNNLMAKKNYILADNSSPINISFATKVQGHFDYVDVEVNYKTFKGKEHKRCYTQTCAVSDARSGLKSAIDQFIKKLPNC